MTQDAPDPDSVIRMQAYDALPPKLRAVISESLPDVWDTFTAADMLKHGIYTEDQLIAMSRNSEINCHNDAVAKGTVPSVQDHDFVLKYVRMPRKRRL